MGRTVKWPGKSGREKAHRQVPRTALGRSLEENRRRLLRIRKDIRVLMTLGALYAAVRPVVRLLWAIFSYLRLRRRQKGQRVRRL